MPFRDNFPASAWIWRVLTGRIACRVYVAIVVLLLIATIAFHIYSFVLTRRIEAVIAGLAKLRIDETTEDEVVRTVPYLIRGKQDRQVGQPVEAGPVDQGVERVFYVTFSNDSSWMAFEKFAERFSRVENTEDEPPKSWIFTAADLLGYRYVGFGAIVVLLDGKVSSIQYGIADKLGFPKALADIVSVRSAHAYWAPMRQGFGVSSTDDESPQFRAEGSDGHLTVSFTFDAPIELRSHAFHVDLNCFWSLFGCHQARQIAPLLWQDKIAIEAATLLRLKSNEPCPDRIFAGRARYLPDLNVLLLESTDVNGESANESGLGDDEIRARYKLIEVLRGYPSQWWNFVRRTATVPYPGDLQEEFTQSGAAISQSWRQTAGVFQFRLRFLRSRRCYAFCFVSGSECGSSAEAYRRRGRHGATVIDCRTNTDGTVGEAGREFTSQ